MEYDIFEKYRQSGKIAAEVRKYGVQLIKPGVRFLDVAEKIESQIVKKGAGIAFPVNISINEIAAHYTPTYDDPLVFRKGDVVKLDVGTHIDGYIADTAETCEVGTNNYEPLISASSEALDNAIHSMKAHVNLAEIGRTVQNTISSFGYKPVDNLTGHSLKQYELHSGMSVPNIENFSQKITPKEGDVLAIEPFASNGAGHVMAGLGSNIYLCNTSLRSRFIRDMRSKIMLQKLSSRFKTLPFAQRWCHNFVSDGIEPVLKKLSFLGLIKHYPQLVDAKGGIVSQKEHTIIVQSDGCEVIT
jgi:methionyl aminopeptidase